MFDDGDTPVSASSAEDLAGRGSNYGCGVGRCEVTGYLVARPVVVQTQATDGFAITARAMFDAVTARTRGIIINSPCNPTGALISEQDLETIAQETSRRGIWIVLDLCYEKLIYDPTPHNLPAVLQKQCPDLAVICGSASKAYAMTGWRCGWSIGPAAVIAAQSAIQSHATSNVSSITQKAVTAALTGSQEPVASMLNEYRTRRDNLHEWLTADPRIRCVKPAGAFYMFPDVERNPRLWRIRDDDRFRAGAAGRVARGGHAGRSVRCPWIRSHVLRHIHEPSSRRQSASAGVRREACP